MEETTENEKKNKVEVISFSCISMSFDASKIERGFKLTPTELVHKLSRYMHQEALNIPFNHCAVYENL